MTANTTPVSVIETVPTSFTVYHALSAGLRWNRKTSPAAQISAMRILD